MHKTYGLKDILNKPGRWWVCCRTDGPQLLEKHQPCLDFLHKHKQDKDLPLTGKGEWDALKWLCFSGYSQRINKAGEEITEAPEQWWPHLATREWPKLWSPLYSDTNSKIQTERRMNERWFDLWTTRTHNCGCTWVVSCGLGMIGYSWGMWGAELPKQAPGLGCAQERTELKEASGFFISPKHVSTGS